MRLIDPSVSEAKKSFERMRDKNALSVSVTNGPSVNEVNGPSVSVTNGLSVNEVNGLKKTKIMSCLRVILAIFFPPLAVIDKGCGSVLIVLLLTCCGWVPGVIGALVILNKNEG